MSLVARHAANGAALAPRPAAESSANGSRASRIVEAAPYCEGERFPRLNPSRPRTIALYCPAKGPDSRGISARRNGTIG